MATVRHAVQTIKADSAMHDVSASAWNRDHTLTGPFPPFVSNTVIGATAFVGLSADYLTLAAQFINVWYCDGTADDVQIIEARDYVGPLGEGTIHFARGVYDVTAQINDGGFDNIKIDCEHGAVFRVANATQISVFYILGQTGWRFKHFEIDGNKGNNVDGGAGVQQYGIYLNTVTDCKVEDVYIHDCVKTGFNVFSASDVSALNVTANDNGESLSSYGSGIDFDDVTGESYILGCTCTGNYTNGIWISTDCIGVIAANNTCNSNGGDAGAELENGFMLQGTRCILEGNIAESNTDNGYLVHTATDCIINTNFGYDNSENFRNTAGSDNLYEGNVSVGGTSGFFIEGTQIIVKGGSSRGASAREVTLWGGDDCEINGVTFRDAVTGVYIDNDANDTIIKDCVFQVCTTGVDINNANCDDTVIIGNDFRGATTPIVDGGTGTVYASMPLQFIQGTTFISADGSAKGWEIDAEADMAIALGQLASTIQQVMRLKVWAVALGAPVNAGGQMHLDVIFEAGGSLEAYNLAANSWTLADFDSEEADYVATDVVHWVIEDGDVGAELGNLLGGDSLTVKLNGGAAADPDGATNATFRVVEIEYV